MTTKTSPRRRIAAVAAVATLGTAAPALAIPAGGLDPVPEPTIDLPSDFTITGAIGVGSCATTADRVSVTATGPSGIRTVRAVQADGIYRYAIRYLDRGTYTVRAKLDAGVCPYGTWSPASRTATSPTGTAPVARGVDFTYRPPSTVARVSAPLVADWLDGALNSARIHLDSYGPLHGQSHHEANASYVSWAGATMPFTIPDIQFDADLCWLCPDFGQARFYVNDMNLRSLDASWTSPAITIDAAFESDGREVKGYLTYAGVGPDFVSDNAMPDMNADDARLRVRLTPVADSSGRLTYSLYGAPSFTGTFQATGPCDLPIDLCDWATDYKSKLKGYVEGSVSTLVGSTTARAAVGEALRPVLAQLGISSLLGVYVEGDTVVLAGS